MHYEHFNIIPARAMRWLSWQSTCSRSLQTCVQILRNHVIAKPCSSVCRALERRDRVGGTLSNSMSLKEMWGPLPPLSLCFLASGDKSLSYAPAMVHCATTDHSNGASWAWTETMSPNQSFLHKLITLGIITMESQLTKKYKMKTNLLSGHRTMCWKETGRLQDVPDFSAYR